MFSSQTSLFEEIAVGGVARLRTSNPPLNSAACEEIGSLAAPLASAGGRSGVSLRKVNGTQPGEPVPQLLLRKRSRSPTPSSVDFRMDSGSLARTDAQACHLPAEAYYHLGFGLPSVPTGVEEMVHPRANVPGGDYQGAPHSTSRSPGVSDSNIDPTSQSDRRPRIRKRKIILKPKYPKYEGLSSFAAPPDLVSEILPHHDIGPSVPSSSDIERSATSSPRPEKSQKNVSRDLIGENIDVGGQASYSDVPIEFLTRLDEKEWSERKTELEKMVEERKKVFLEGGFAEASGKPFDVNETAIEKKPVPNRWVWYMRLSTDYDRSRNTRVPAGGPAGYLKHGWDRLGTSGKQPYQELADIYAAQRQKYMADHGLQENVPKNPKPKRTEKQGAVPKSSSESTVCNDISGQMLSPFAPQSYPLESDRGEFSSASCLNTLVPVENCVEPFSSVYATEVLGGYQDANSAFQLGSPLGLSDASDLGAYPSAEIPLFSSYVHSQNYLPDFASLPRQDLVLGEPTYSRFLESSDSPLRPASPNLEGAFHDTYSSAAADLADWPALSPGSRVSNYSELSTMLMSPTDFAPFDSADVPPLSSPIGFQDYHSTPGGCSQSYTLFKGIHPIFDGHLLSEFC